MSNALWCFHDLAILGDLGNGYEKVESGGGNSGTVYIIKSNILSP